MTLFHCIFTWWKGKNFLSGASLLRELIPFMRDPPNHFPKTLPPNAIKMEIRFHDTNFGIILSVDRRESWWVLVWICWVLGFLKTFQWCGFAGRGHQKGIRKEMKVWKGGNLSLEKNPVGGKGAEGEKYDNVRAYLRAWKAMPVKSTYPFNSNIISENVNHLPSVWESSENTFLRKLL